MVRVGGMQRNRDREDVRPRRDLDFRNTHSGFKGRQCRWFKIRKENAEKYTAILIKTIKLKSFLSSQIVFPI